MGWGSGIYIYIYIYIADDLWDAIKDGISKETKIEIAKSIIEVFKNHDCDNMEDTSIWEFLMANDVDFAVPYIVCRWFEDEGELLGICQYHQGEVKGKELFKKVKQKIKEEEGE